MLIKPNLEKITKIKVIGVGGGGGNALNSMIAGGKIIGVDFMAINTDAQALYLSQANEKVQIGKKLTDGLGNGAIPEIGRKSAEESRDEIKKHIENCDMIFLIAGMSGGTGTGASPVIATIAKRCNVPVVAIVTTPFDLEGTKRAENSKEGIIQLKDRVDALIVISNQKLLDLEGKNITLRDAYALSDKVLEECVISVYTLIVKTEVISIK